MTPIYDQLVAELGDPKQFGAHEHSAWAPWTYTPTVLDLSAAPMTRAQSRTRTAKRRKR